MLLDKSTGLNSEQAAADVYAYDMFLLLQNERQVCIEIYQILLNVN